MSKWALILGGSSGIGLAAARKLGQHGFNLLIVHRDRRADLDRISSTFQSVEKEGVQVASFNFDATSEEKTDEYLPQILEVLKGDKIDVLIHSISRGNLKPLTSMENRLSKQDLALTMDAMAFSLSSWVNILLENRLLGNGASVISLTSAGGNKYWPGYAAVGMAKSALETMTRYLAVELASSQITVNCIHAGITDTPSLRMIPGYEELKETSTSKNPGKRMTTPEDVANVIYLLTLPEARWITGSIVHVDGGEHLIG